MLKKITLIYMLEHVTCAFAEEGKHAGLTGQQTDSHL